MRINKEAVLFWASVVSALQTPLTIIQLSSLFAKCGVLLIGSLGLMYLILLLLRRHGVVIFGKQLVSIIKLVEKVKQKAEAFDPSGYEWDRKLDDFRFILADMLGRWPNKWFNSKLCAALSLRVPWEISDSAEIGLKEALGNSFILWNTVEFLGDLHGWRMSGMGKCTPGRGIDANIDSLIKEEIAKRISDKFSRWFSTHRVNGDWVSVLFVGANDQKLSELILDGMRKVRECRGLQLFIVGTSDENELHLRLRYGKDDRSGNANKIVLQREQDRQPKYDVAIATHYYQHHELTHYKRMPLNVVDDGMVVWLSALSRSYSIDEYVCEGCMPLRATLLSQERPVHNEPRLAIQRRTITVEVESMSKMGVRERISYEPLRGFDEHVSVLSSGYPKKFIVNQDVFYKNPAGVVCQYLQWNQRQPISRLLIESEYHEKEDRKQFRYKINDVKCVTQTRVTCGDSSTWYGVLELQYKSDCLHSLYLIANTGLEINEWDPMVRGKGQCLVTITPAVRYLTGTESWNYDSPRRLVLESLKQRFENDDANRRDRYAELIEQGQLNSQDPEIAVFELRTKIEEVDLNHLMFVVAHHVVDSCDAVFCSYLPKRRYLTQHDYDIEYGIMEDFKHAVKKMDESMLNDFIPVMTHSVTWLRSFEGIISDFSKRGWVVDENGCFFHKLLGRVLLDDADKKRYEGRGVDLNCLNSEGHSLAKDCTFNQLTFEDRIKFLGVANVHDVLIFATSKVLAPHGYFYAFKVMLKKMCYRMGKRVHKWFAR